eukprot:TRINITY_DN667_c0_g1_i1.p1 TRINITY_DN667_c0_g1~~TRINITY_DN667_c0_g1_i1.p1  ORF type:complete len:138 (+),score=37.50 TRINITY_DN667_c0_g1_i1:63-476(+)
MSSSSSLSSTVSSSSSLSSSSSSSSTKDVTMKNSDTKENKTDSTKTPPPPPVVVKKWAAVAFGALDMEKGGNDICSICRSELLLPCIKCAAEPSRNEECTVSHGSCGHSFHFHCVSRWLKTRTTCPIDDSEWDFVQF